MAYDPELEAFKTDIDLRHYAASRGYEQDKRKRESSRSSTIMRHSNGDKIIIKRGGDRHYVYFSVRDDSDNGSIIDFVQKRQGLNLGQVRKELRPWVHKFVSPSLPRFAPLETTSKDRLRVESEYRAMKEARRHPYLEEVRLIPPELLESPRFAGRVRIDRNGNAVFPHFDQDELCGYEVKNRNFTGFAKGGEKGLWLSQEFPDDNCLLFAESAIDALSHAALFPSEKTRYSSIGGQVNPTQPDLIKAAIAGMPEGSEIVAAMDANEAGSRLVEIVRQAFEEIAVETGRTDLIFKLHLPDQEDKDWNDVLRERGVSFPTARVFDF
jgi:hypothetical protein